MAKFRSTIYRERVPGSPRMSFRGKQTESQRIIDIPCPVNRGPEVLYQAIKDFCGYTIVRGQGANKTLMRITPHQHPVMPWLYCTDVANVEGIAFREKWTDMPPEPGENWIQGLFGGGNPEETAPLLYGPQPVAHYKIWRVTFNYRALTYNILPYAEPGKADESDLKSYVTKIFRPGGDYLTLPTNFMKFVPSKDIVPQGLGRLIPSFSFQCTWHQIPLEAVPMLEYNPNLTAPAIDLCYGKVNTEPFAGFAKGCVLFVSCDEVPERMSNGGRYLDLIYHFKYIPLDTAAGMDADIGSHNSLIKKEGDNLVYREVSADGVKYALNLPQKHLYDGADLRTLFKPGV